MYFLRLFSLIGTEEEIGNFDLICRKDTTIQIDYYTGNKMAMLGCKCDRNKSYRQLAANLNVHYKNQEANKKVEEPISPTKKGFSVRRQKRASSLVKSSQETTVKKVVGLEIPKMPNRTYTRKIYDSNVNI